jgi:NAD(P)-dependent dehydrogenase (short-subunit alcohol dehydrogenase family)
MSVWFITGASRGFGIEITRQALGRGDQVAATARHPEAITQAIPDAGDALLALPLDVTSAGQGDLDLHRLPHLTDMTAQQQRSSSGESRALASKTGSTHKLGVAKGRWVP